MKHIIILDTGVNLSHPKLNEKNIRCKRITDSGFEEIFEDSDANGHGTAICGIITEKNANIKLTMYKIFDSEDYVDEEILLKTLVYIFENEKFDFLHLSLGISQCNNIEKFEKLCNDMARENIIIVSAFSNYGTASYPTAFSSVIGVDSLIECKKNDDFIYSENSIVNVYAKGTNQRVCWSNKQKYIINSGNSFASAHVTAFLLNTLEKNKLNLEQAKKKLKEKALYVINSPLLKIKKIDFPFQNIAVFPLNKEIYSTLNYRNMLRCNVSIIFDIRESGKIGDDIQKYLFKDDFASSLNIINLFDFEFHVNEFDTLVIGHLKKINEITGIDYKQICINFCLNNYKNLISFDDLSDDIIEKFTKKNLSCFYCNVENINYDLNEKLRIIGVPSIVVCGTSSQQGKFSLQLELRKKFITEGYSVGQWSSEPQGYLFDIDEVFPLGFGSNNNFSEKQVIHYINNQLHSIEKEKKDIIISGIQSFTITERLYNTIFYPSLQNSIISALQPDCVVLMVNSYDNIDYIRRTISYIESICETKVVCLVLSFKDINKTWSSMELSIKKIEEKKSKIKIEAIKKELNRPCYNYDEIDKVFEQIIKYLS